MKKTIYALSAAATLLLVGCGTSSDSTGATDIAVERGPLLYATVTDALGRRAVMQAGGLYRFASAPEYPVTSYGGVIDLNRNNVIDEGDMLAGKLQLTATQGNAATVVSSMAVNEQLRTMLQEDFNLSESQVFNETPSSDKQIAAVSDEVFKYCVENNVSNPALLTLQEMEAIKTQIAERIRTYETSELSTAELERELVRNELSIQTMTQTDAQDVNEQLENGKDKDASQESSDASSSRQNSSMAQNQNGSDASEAGSSSEAPEMHGNASSAKSSCDGSCSSSSEADDYDEEAELTDEQKYTLAYMWNEEKMAKDLYLALNDVWPSQTLYNIATKAETEHQKAVEGLIEAYDINITNLDDYEEAYSEAELRTFAAGEFGIPEVQELYDILFAKGVQSAQDALEVGCMVEVTDVNDLNEDIETARGADDLVQVFEHLRNGSYNHYWAFDTALKSMGVADGCCLLGEDFCKTEEEYPRGSGK